MGVLKGGAVRAYYGSAPIGHAFNCDLSLTADVVEKDSKDVATFPTYEVTKVKGILKVDAFFGHTTTNAKPFDLARLMIAKTPLSLFVQTENSGDDNFQFDGVITAMEFSHEVNSISAYSVTFQISGEITIDLSGTTVIGDSQGDVIGDTSGVVIGW